MEIAAWITAAALLFAGLMAYWCLSEDDQHGIGEAFGCLVFIVFALLALVILGIFVW